MNQVIFKEILIEVDGSVVYARMAQPFAAFHDEEFRSWVAATVPSPGPFQDRGSNINDLVGKEDRHLWTGQKRKTARCWVRGVPGRVGVWGGQKKAVGWVAPEPAARDRDTHLLAPCRR